MGNLPVVLHEAAVEAVAEVDGEGGAFLDILGRAEEEVGDGVSVAAAGVAVNWPLKVKDPARPWMPG
jgi:hypothetical protein